MNILTSILCWQI